MLFKLLIDRSLILENRLLCNMKKNLTKHSLSNFQRKKLVKRIIRSGESVDYRLDQVLLSLEERKHFNVCS